MRKFFPLIILLCTLGLNAQSPLLNWNREVMVVSATVRRATTGWQFVTPNHDPLGFSGVITATSSQLTLDMDFDGLGMNPAEWTPSGVVCGADETYAREGHTFGASVSSTSIIIQGCNGIVPSQQIVFNGTSWAGASGYTASWNTSQQCLQLDRILTDNSNYRQGIQSGGVPGIAIQTNVTSLTQLFYNAVLVENSNTRIRIAFYNNGIRVTTPDVNCKVFITDFAKRPQTFDFTSNVAAMQGNSNIWIVGTFVKIITPAAFGANEDENSFSVYPNPSSGDFKIKGGDTSPITVLTMDGNIIFEGQIDDAELNTGTYIIRQNGLSTKLIII